MTVRGRPIWRARARFIALTTIVLVAGITVWLAITFMLGLSASLTAIVPITLALATAAWAILHLRNERAEHEIAIGRWAAAEAVLAERLRIARDLHDIVSHGLGMITIRAAAAQHLDARQEDRQPLLEALEDVENISRQATLELRRMLDMLRETGTPVPMQPADNLESLPDIIDQARRTGLRIDLDLEPLENVSPGVQLAISIVVREALANTARHAGPTRTRVRLSKKESAITLSITDEGPAHGWVAAPGAGRGLLGLRERIHSLGGTLHAEPYEVGFRLEALLPDGEKT